MAVGIRLVCAFMCSMLLSGLGVLSLPSPAQAQIFLETPDLGVRVRPPQGGCARGRRCRFTVIVRNRGDADFSAPIYTSHSARPPRLRISSSEALGWFCQRGQGQLSCAKQRPFLASGQRSRYALTVFVPRDVVRRRIRVCASINWRQPGALVERTRTVQRLLLREGYRVGRPDGEIGPRTREGIARYQADEGLPVTGRIDRQLLDELTGEWGVGDARARNDSACVQARLYNAGTFERLQDEEPDILPPPNEAERPTERQSTGRRLRCPPSRVQEGRTCVCRSGLVEDETGACIAQGGFDPAPQPQREPPAPAPQQAACSGGKERNAAGRCACPRGLEDVDGICQLPQQAGPAPKPKNKVIKKKLDEPRKPSRKQAEPATTASEPDGKACKNNMILNENGKCQCSENREIRDGKCVLRQN